MSVAIRLFAVLSPPLRARFARSVPQGRNISGLDGVAGELTTEEGAVVFVDPAADERFAERVLELRQRFPSASFVIYTALQPTQIRRCLALVAAGISDLVFCGFDDTPERLRKLVADIEARRANSTLGTLLQAHLDQLPPRLRDVVTRAIAEPERCYTTKDIAHASGMSTRAVFRHTRAAGFASLRLLLASLRIAQAYSLIVQHGQSVTEAAARLKYRSPDQLCQHMVELTGQTPSEVKKGLPPDKFHAAIVFVLTHVAHERREPVGSEA